MPIYHSVTELIGRTPLLELCNYERNHDLKAVLLAKLECMNPAGSAKDRVAANMIARAETEGRLAPGGTIIEPTSGNTGIGLAAAAAAKGYRVILTMPDTMSVERRALIAAYGAEIILTPGAAGMAGAVAKAEELTAGISEEDEEELRELLANKNFFGVEEFAETLNLKAELNELFHMLGSLNVDLNDLKRAKEAAASYPRILAAIHNLEELHKVLEVYGIQKYISFELGIISSYQYYTGIIFSGYTFGSGEPIVKGGRYDKLLTYYGKTSASIGFAIVIDQLMAALSRQKINITIETNGELIVYTKAAQAKAILSAKEKRAAGTPVETILKDDTKTNEDYQNYAKRNRIRTVTFMED